MGDVWCSPSLSLCCCSDWILLLCLFDGSCVRGWMVVLFWFSLDDVSCFDGVTECGLSPFMCPRSLLSLSVSVCVCLSLSVCIVPICLPLSLSVVPVILLA